MYQVFIDEHSISIGEKRKSNQQFESIFEMNEPNVDDLNFVIDWLLKERESTQHVFLNTKNVEELWNLFQAQFKLIQAAGGKVINSENEILFISRLGKWDLPKGKIESGETPEVAAIREVEEECGISNLKILEILSPTFHVYGQNEKKHLKKTFWYRMSYEGNETLVPQLEERIAKAEWVNAGNLTEQLSNTYSSLKKIILE